VAAASCVLPTPRIPVTARTTATPGPAAPSTPSRSVRGTNPGGCCGTSPTTTGPAPAARSCPLVSGRASSRTASMAASRLSIWSILPSSRSPSRKLRSCPSWLASGSSGPPRAPRPVICRTRREASFSATCAAETPSASADDHLGSVVMSGSSNTASWAAIPARRSSSNVPCSPAGCGAGVLKTSPTTIATSSAAAASPGRRSAAVAVSAARQAWCSARTCSSPSTKVTSFLRPASASRPTSQAPRSSATKATPPLSRPHRQSGTQMRWPVDKASLRQGDDHPRHQGTQAPIPPRAAPRAHGGPHGSRVCLAR